MAPSFLDLDPRSPYGQAAWQDSTKWSGHRTVHRHRNGGNIIRHRNCVRMWSWAETSCGLFIYDDCCLTARPRLKGWLCISPHEQPRPRRTDFSAEHSARSPFLPSCKGFWILINNRTISDVDFWFIKVHTSNWSSNSWRSSNSWGSSNSWHR